MVNQSMSSRKRVLDCPPLKPTLKKKSTSGVPEDRPRKRVSFSAQTLTEPSKGHHDGIEGSVCRHDSVDERGNRDAVPSPVFEASIGKTNNTINRKKSSSLTCVKGSPSNNSTGVKSQTEFNHDSTKCGEGNKQSVSPTYQCHKNGPAKDYIWRGIIEVVDCGMIRLSEEMIAHLSAKVSRKAFEFSKKMDSKLQFKLLPRADFYPQIFQNARPDRDDIALYFYPTRAERSRKQYSQLVKDMELKDLMMRSRIKGRELLVFPSTILPEDSQKLKNCYFMWGVFLHVKDELDF